jgi:hypothetical protein
MDPVIDERKVHDEKTVKVRCAIGKGTKSVMRETRRVIVFHRRCHQPLIFRDDFEMSL